MRCSVACFLVSGASAASFWRVGHRRRYCPISVARGGHSSGGTQEQSLDERVHAAMRRLGLNPDATESSSRPSSTTTPAAAAASENDGTPTHAMESREEESTTTDVTVATTCADGVCTPPSSVGKTSRQQQEEDEGIDEVVQRIMKETDVVNRSVVLAALGATRTEGGKFNEGKAKDLLRSEMEAVRRVSEDSDEVKELVAEGHDVLLVRRALAFADMNVLDARAILQADLDDEQEEESFRLEEEKKLSQEAERREAVSQMKTIRVDANFDPTRPPGGVMDTATTDVSSLKKISSRAPPKQQQPAKKEDVVFDATTAQVQRLVLESPVPVLLDVYADWCGPCKTLTPVLEQMAVRAGGVFRLVKINSDKERSISTALEVKALPTIFGIRNGKVVDMFQGMPRDEEFMRNFMLNLLTTTTTKPKKEFEELSIKLTRVAGSASLSFAARERLQHRTEIKLDELVSDSDMADAEESAKIIRALLSNVIHDPYEPKFRKINLQHKTIAARISAYPSAIALLKGVGFTANNSEDPHHLVLSMDKKTVNVAPLVVVRDAIDKWMDQNRYKIAAAARKKKDEMERVKLQHLMMAEEEEDEEESEENEELDPNACLIKLRVEGKKKIHDIYLHADDPLDALIQALPENITEDGGEVQITCAARRLVVRSTDSEAMKRSMREHKLTPLASIVITKIGGGSASSGSDSASLKDRAAARQLKKKKGVYHTMQSVGIYSKDDNNKGELIDGGGGVWYEQDVTTTDGEEDNETEKDETDGDDTSADQQNDEEVV